MLLSAVVSKVHYEATMVQNKTVVNTPEATILINYFSQRSLRATSQKIVRNPCETQTSQRAVFMKKIYV